MNFCNDALCADAGRGHASSSWRTEHERDRLDARGDFVPRDADRRSTAAGATDSAVPAVAAALTGLPARRRRVASLAPSATVAANLTGRSLAPSSALSPTPRLEQRRFDAHAAVVDNHGERTAATAAGLSTAASATGVAALAASAADTERNREVASGRRFAAGTAPPGDARLSVFPGLAAVVAEVASRFDLAETEERRRARRARGSGRAERDYRRRRAFESRLSLDAERDVAAVAAVTTLDESVGAEPS